MIEQYFEEKDFTNETFSNLDVNEGIFDKASFYHCNFSTVRFLECSFASTYFRGSAFSNIIFDCCNLRNANFLGTTGLLLPDRQKHKDILKEVAKIVLAEPSKLDMSRWHHACNTVHCVAGWISHLVSEKDGIDYEGKGYIDAFGIATYLLDVDCRVFYSTDDDALDF